MTHRILVVDDDPDVLALVSMVLSLDGHEVLEATSPLEAQAVLEEAAPDLVITDLNFGTETSLDFTRRGVAEGRRIIVMTAAVSAVDVPADLDDQVRILRKPFSLEELRAAVTGSLEP
jgi:DNA-binding response OmpR family regulator